MGLEYTWHSRRLLERETGDIDTTKGSTSLSVTDEEEEKEWRDEEGEDETAKDDEN